MENYWIYQYQNNFLLWIFSMPLDQFENSEENTRWLNELVLGDFREYKDNCGSILPDDLRQHKTAISSLIVSATEFERAFIAMHSLLTPCCCAFFITYIVFSSLYKAA